MRNFDPGGTFCFLEQDAISGVWGASLLTPEYLAEQERRNKELSRYVDSLRDDQKTGSMEAFMGEPMMIDARPVMKDDPWQNSAYIPMGRQETSRQAAFDFAPKARSLREQVLNAIRYAGEQGMTDNELIATFPEHSPNSIRPRRIDLVRQEKIKNSGLTRNGSIVWIAV
jgi:hypothetical protein